jgi:hypothetical protein
VDFFSSGGRGFRTIYRGFGAKFDANQVKDVFAGFFVSNRLAAVKDACAQLILH